MSVQSEFRQYDSLISGILQETRKQRGKPTNPDAQIRSSHSRINDSDLEKSPSTQFDVGEAGLNFRQYSPLVPVRVYGRTDKVPIINLTGPLKNHIAYVASNYAVIWDFIKDDQKVLPGHRNKIVAMEQDPRHKFFATGDWGPDSCVIIWDIFSGNPFQVLRLEGSHPENNGIAAINFAARSNYIGVLGAERTEPQIISIWQYDNTRSPRVLCSIQVPEKVGFQHEIKFHPIKFKFFATTGFRGIVFYSWNRQEKKIYIHVPKMPRSFIHGMKKFTQSIWEEDTERLLTATMSGCVVIWDVPPATGITQPPDSTRNIREFHRAYKLGTSGLTVLQKHKEFYVVGDEDGIIKFFDVNFRLLRWIKLQRQLPPIYSIAFNQCDHDPPHFQKAMRKRYKGNLPTHIHKEKPGFIRDYTLGMKFFHQPSQTTIRREPFVASDFFIGVAHGNVYYCHLAEERLDLVVHGANSRIAACDVNPITNHLALATHKGEILLYDTKTHHVVCRKRLFKKTNRVTALKFHPSGAYAFLGVKTGKILYRNAYDWRPVDAPFDYSSSPIKKIEISADGLLFAYHDASRAIGLYEYQPRKHAWGFKGKQRFHCKPVLDLLFYFDAESRQNRLFSLGEDRRIVEYDILSSSMSSGLQTLSVVRIEQFSKPTAMTIGNPFPGIKLQILISNNAYKISVYDPDDQIIRKTCQGPAFGTPINKMMALNPLGIIGGELFTVIVSNNKLGFAKPPLDGNPSKFMAVLTHPTGIKDVTASKDNRWLFTIGAVETICVQWSANFKAVESGSVAGGTETELFLRLLERDMPKGKSLAVECKNCFCMLLMQKSMSTHELLRSEAKIKISEIPTVVRFCGYFPTEYEIQRMKEEAEYAGVIDHGKRNEDIAFNDFIKLFANHRRFPSIQRSTYASAFRQISMHPYGDAFIKGARFRRLLAAKGEKIPEAELQATAPYLYWSALKETDSGNNDFDPEEQNVVRFSHKETIEMVSGRLFLDTTYSRDVPLPMSWETKHVTSEGKMNSIQAFIAKKKQVRKDYPALGYLNVRLPGNELQTCK